MVHKVCVAILMVGLVFAQMFEVASVRPTTAKDPRLVSRRGGPGTTDPTHFRAANYPLIRVVCEAYNRQLFQITYPDWMFFTRFDIAANVPPGATKKDLRVMLQQLLAERFKLQTHGEHKLMEVYALTVSKVGPKVKKSAEPAEEDSESQVPGEIKRDKDGYPMPPPGAMTMMGDLARINGSKTSMSALATQLMGQVQRPVIDETNLDGDYDFTLSWNTRLSSGEPRGDGSDIGLTLVDALEKQLGLKLQSKKMMIDKLVIDHADKLPTEN